MADYNAWNQLFRLNPDTPQTPMLSTQELQEELALWGNAQFQLEPVTEDTKEAKSSRKSSTESSQAWGLLESQGQMNPLSFMMDSSSDLLAAITKPGAQQSSWAQQQQQQQQAPMMIGGVPMLPLAPAPTANHKAQVASKASKMVAIAPAPSKQEQGSVPKKAAGQGKAEDEESGDEEMRRKAAEEDKRRRNTAASARFRVKKKLKEQALERTAREMTAKAEALEKRVQELETETRWLKSLITERDPDALNRVGCPCHHPEGLDEPAAKRART
ncbi:hypothetical protein EV183_004548 [Coemansia sp. RSA 2336]|nr:hypothetical protein EV183_004548 [Coemansia sp. RSA 2336]